MEYLYTPLSGFFFRCEVVLLFGIADGHPIFDLVVEIIGGNIVAAIVCFECFNSCAVAANAVLLAEVETAFVFSHFVGRFEVMTETVLSTLRASAPSIRQKYK